MTSTRRIRRVRRSAAGVLGVIGCAFVAVAVIGMWAKNDLLNTQHYMSEVGPVVDSPAVQTDLAAAISTRIEQSLDLESVLRSALPKGTKELAPALANGADQLVASATQQLVRSTGFSDAWTSANRVAHQQLVAIVRGHDSAMVSSSSGTAITLSLQPVVDDVLSGVSKKTGLNLSRVVDTSTINLDFVLVRSDTIGTAQTAVKWLDRLGPAAWIAAVICLLGAIALSLRRIGAAAFCAWGIALVNAALLAAAQAGWSALEGNVDDSGLGVTTAKSLAAALASPLVDRIRLLLIASVAVAVVLTAVSRVAARRSRKKSVLDDNTVQPRVI